MGAGLAIMINAGFGALEPRLRRNTAQWRVGNISDRAPAPRGTSPRHGMIIDGAVATRAPNYSVKTTIKVAGKRGRR